MENMALMLSIFVFMGMPVSAAILAPTATGSAANYYHGGWSPQPTTPPEMHELDLRQAQMASYAMAPDKTCGWVNGNSSSRLVTCGDAFRCVFLLPSGTIPGRVGCCPEAGCSTNYAWRTACVGTTDKCDSQCSRNSAIRKCNSDRPFCHPVNYIATNSIYAFTCGATAFSSGQKTPLLRTTYTGAKTSRNYRTFVTGFVTVTETAGGPGDEEDGEPTAAPVDGDGGGGGGGGGGDNSGSAPVGAIVGGVVGGIAAIAIAAGAGAFFYRRKQKRSQDIGGHSGLPENTHLRSPKLPLLNAGQAAKIPQSPVEMDGAPVRQVHELGSNGSPTRPVHELG